jgi:hypothetical protein
MTFCSVSNLVYFCAGAGLLSCDLYGAVDYKMYQHRIFSKSDFELQTQEHTSELANASVEMGSNNDDSSPYCTVIPYNIGSEAIPPFGGVYWSTSYSILRWHLGNEDHGAGLAFGLLYSISYGRPNQSNKYFSRIAVAGNRRRTRTTFRKLP